MSRSIDVYEFRETVIDRPTDEIIDAIVLKCPTSDAMFLVEVGGDGVPQEITDSLIQLGYEEGYDVYLKISY